ncbi:hypothetical protein WQQ_26280 [Hydrocarboniphaga effusa AP103]|uniref:Uncharacterized protein n=1 Tax=Hydrocarboniphaga effusa AP103 TaxID=1172194 RepID=I8HZL8_9GAMM|nr:hypothetical protein WQQ_26280 [Hydrocarboniphaga effusa AP103]
MGIQAGLMPRTQLVPISVPLLLEAVALRLVRGRRKVGSERLGRFEVRRRCRRCQRLREQQQRRGKQGRQACAREAVWAPHPHEKAADQK